MQIKNKHKYWLTCISLIFLLSSKGVLAGEHDKWLNWQDTSIAGLYGGGFEVDPSDQTTITLEHASDWSFGDLFMFLDGTKYSHGDVNGNGDREAWYGEITARLSTGKLTDTDFHFSIFQQDLVIFKDILFAINYERGRDRDATEFPFQIGKAKFLADGYFDYVFGSGPQHANFHFNPQIKLDLGNFYGSPDKLFVGVEIDYWTNKYGIKDSSAFDTDQFAVSGIIKYHF
jgi:nucleoside-specific outer membrane channel protein Tsx